MARSASSSKRGSSPASPDRSNAVRGAVNGLMGQVLEGHIREHMQPLAVDGEPEATEGLIKVLRSYLK